MQNERAALRGPAGNGKNVMKTTPNKQPPIPLPSRDMTRGFSTWQRDRGFFIEPMRTKGSCRFAAYYKVQFWNETSLAWHDIQKSHPTRKAAESAFIDGRKCRVMEITTKGRNPLP
jgi:hypothetical protein